MNKLLIYVLALCFAVGVVTYIVFYFSPESVLLVNVMKVYFSAFQIIALMLLLSNGTLMDTIYWNLILFFLGIIIIAAMFKIMHWPYGNAMLAVSCAGICISYSTHFLFKKQKRRLDISKWIWVIASYTGIGLAMFRLVPREYMLIPLALLWMIILDFSIQEIRRKEPSDEKE